ncbi:beta-N-acetylhexosaminidase [Aurantimicrobium minutum]|uniref:glycoside hydrolase family 3 N-terminal domain-containing protein n=1 Tax=Aurantimicrobium minutum TaxID=708131 RepID=UPI002474731F|nr:glycoside hydrolase family 3 N-terminal domain-containing protein [Aurantimicrobium minutum]MDH6532880.1 beta-N-acetylhexosaminidase [Aurantimicrobium minutum]
MGSRRRRILRWLGVLTAVVLILVGIGLLNVPRVEPLRFGDPSEYIQMSEPVSYEPWGSHPVDFYVTETLSAMSLEDKIRSLLIVNYPGTDLVNLQDYLSRYRPSGFILMGSNIPATPEELSNLTAGIRGSAELPLFIGIDEEGGQVKRLPYDVFAGADLLRNEPPEATTAAFQQRGELLKRVGTNLNFGVVADVSADPLSFIYGRSFGAEGVSAGERVAAAVEAENVSVLSTIKHFPGHGSAPGDSHVGVPSSPLTYEQWIASDALPFEAGISAGADMVMFGHLSFPAIDPLPSSLSPAWHSILRQQLGFTGIIITDDMTMLENSSLPEYSDPVTNAVWAIAAGNDMLLYVPSVSFDPDTVVAGVASAVRSGRIPESQITDSVTRVLTQRRLLFPDAERWIPPCDERCFVWGYVEVKKEKG